MRTSTNCPRPVAGKVLFDSRTSGVLPLPCNTWACRVCGPAKAFRLGIHAASARPERFITLSRVGPDLEIVHERLKTLSKALRRSGYGWEYLAVPELHQNGSWHLHLLQKNDFIPQRLLSHRADAAGMGYVVDIQRIRGAGEVPKYLCKYLTKQSLSERLAAEGRMRTKRYRTSRRFWPGGRAAVPSGGTWSVEDVGPFVER